MICEKCDGGVEVRINAEDIQVVKAMPGDVIVYHPKRPIGGPREIMNAANVIKTVFPNNEVVILFGDIEVRAHD